MSEHFVKISTVQDVRIVALSLPRVVDLYEFDRINTAIGRVTDKDAADRWILDLHGAEYVGSALLGLMVNLRQRIKGGAGFLVVCGLSDALAAALRTCSLYNLFSIAKSRDEAMKLVRSLR